MDRLNGNVTRLECTSMKTQLGGFTVKKQLLLIAPLFIFLLATTSTVQAQFYSLEEGDGLVNDVSNNGIAVGSFLNADNEYFSWEIGVGGKVNIGGVPAGGGVGGQAGISNDGSIVVGSDFNSMSGFNEASVYDMSGGTWTNLGGIGSSSGSSISSGWGISGDGQTVVGLGWVNAGEAHGFYSQGGVNTDLGSTVFERSSRANAASYDGSVVGGWQDATSGFRQGAVWVNGAQQLIFNSSGEAAQEVSAVSDNGRYLTGLDVAGIGQVANAYRYDLATDTFHELDNLLGTSRMSGVAINADGSLIGGGMWDFGPATLGTGFVWEEGVGTMLVEDFLMSRGISGWDPDFEFSFVSGISADGQWLVGWGRDANFNNVSWAARISTVPEPSAFTLITIAAMAGLVRRRRGV